MNKTEIKAAIKEIKISFSQFKNGMVSDALKQAGYPYKLIYGLQLTQLKEISKQFTKDFELANTLWEDSDIRESRLLSCHLFPLEKVGLKEGKRLIESLQTREEAEILVFCVLRHLPFSLQLAKSISAGGKYPFAQYCAELIEKSGVEAS